MKELYIPMTIMVVAILFGFYTALEAITESKNRYYTIDTHATIKQLIEAGFTEKQSQAIVYLYHGKKK